VPVPQLPGTVEGTVEQVRKRVDELPLPPAVKEPVQPVLDQAKPVLDTVQQVGRTVDGVTKPLLPTLP
jgi:hypothetical protein